MENHLSHLFRAALIEGWERPVFCDYQGESFTGKQVAAKIKSLHNLYNELGIERGDKIALLGNNTSHWAITYVSVMTYGCVVVPILPDFSKEEILHICEHSEAVLGIFADGLHAQLEGDTVENLKNICSLNDFRLLQGDGVASYTEIIDIQKNDLIYNPLPGNVLGVILYTSGTSGFSKGVMLTAHNLYSNIQFILDELSFVKKGSTMLSFLPLAHTMGCTFEFLWPFCAGLTVHFLEKMPSPMTLIKAFQEVRPVMIFMVPLLIEKVYQKQLKPIIKSNKMRILLNIPIVNQLIYKKICKKLKDSFGGNLYEIGIGGAPLNPEVEAFMQKIKFPIATAYGMTECAPFISYIDWKHFKKQASGKAVDRMEIKIDLSASENNVGEILVRGENLMLGYYKNEEATKEAFCKDGWFRTGDLGEIDDEGFVYVRGRSKSMLLGSSGQNIYPEEIEAKVNSVAMVTECIVIDDKQNRLLALVYPDFEYCRSQGWKSKEQISEKLEEERIELNKELSNYKRLHKMIIVDKEFEKTPKKSIKRYLYSNYS